MLAVSSQFLQLCFLDSVLWFVLFIIACVCARKSSSLYIFHFDMHVCGFEGGRGSAYLCACSSATTPTWNVAAISKSNSETIHRPSLWYWRGNRRREQTGIIIKTTLHSYPASCLSYFSKGNNLYLLRHCLITRLLWIIIIFRLACFLWSANDGRSV